MPYLGNYYLTNIINFLSIIIATISAIIPIITILYDIRKGRNKHIDIKPAHSVLRGKYSQLWEFYENERFRNRMWMSFSVITISLGALVIVGVIGVAFSYIYIGGVLLGIGISLEAIGIFFFWRTREATKEIDKYYIKKLTEAESISRLITLLQSESDEQNDLLKERVISNLLITTPKQEVVTSANSQAQSNERDRKYEDGLSSLE